MAIFSVDLNSLECDGHVVVKLCGELDLSDAAAVAAALVTVAASEPNIIVDLRALDFIDCSGVAALARGRALARHAGGDLLLAAPQPRVLRVLTITRLIDAFSVHPSVDEAVHRFGRPLTVAVPAPGRPDGSMHWPRAVIRSAPEREHSSSPRRAGQAGA